MKKQAKVLEKSQIKAALKFIETRRNAARDRVAFLLSLHGLRACEIADLELAMVVDAQGNVAEKIELADKATKGGSGGRIIFINATLKASLENYLKVRKYADSKYLITTERSGKFSANAVAVLFFLLYRKLGWIGASSHSGRRTFITNCARRVIEAGGSIKDIQAMVGHAYLSSTQRYIEQDSNAQRKLVDLVYQGIQQALARMIAEVVFILALFSQMDRLWKLLIGLSNQYTHFS